MLLKVWLKFLMMSSCSTRESGCKCRDVRLPEQDFAEDSSDGGGRACCLSRVEGLMGLHRSSKRCMVVRVPLPGGLLQLKPTSAR
jgi:hypothetical protein